MKNRSGSQSPRRWCRIVVLVASVAMIATMSGVRAEERQFELGIVGTVLSPAIDAVRVEKGDTVVLIWTSDATVEIHLHGYDLHITAGPETPAQQRFEAFATGRFPFTVHGNDHGHAESPLTYLEVLPE